MKEFQTSLEGYAVEIQKKVVSRDGLKEILQTYDARGLTPMLEELDERYHWGSDGLFRFYGCDTDYAQLTVDDKVVHFDDTNLKEEEEQLNEYTDLPKGGGLFFYFSPTFHEATGTCKVRTEREFDPTLLEIKYRDYEIGSSAPNMNFVRSGTSITDVIYEGEGVFLEYEDDGAEINYILLIPNDRKEGVSEGEMRAVLYHDSEKETHVFDAEALRRYLQAE